MRTTQFSEVSFCRQQQQHNQENHQSSNNQAHGQESCRCCCCINYNFFTLGYQLARSSQNFGLPLTPQLFSSYLELKDRHIKEEDEVQKEVDIIPEVPAASLTSCEQKNKNSGQQLQQNLPVKVQPGKRNKTEQQEFDLAYQNKTNYERFKDNQGNKIFKINNLGEESENNSSLVRQQQLLDHQQSKDIPLVLEEISDLPNKLKQEQVVNQKEEENQQDIFLNSSQIQRAIGGQSSNIVDDLLQPSLPNRNEQSQPKVSPEQERYQNGVEGLADEQNSQNQSEYSDNVMLAKKQNPFKQKQEYERLQQPSKIEQSEEQRQDELLQQSQSEKSNNENNYYQDEGSRAFLFQEAKNEDRSSQANPKHKIKEEKVQNFAINDPQQQESSVYIINDAVQENPFHPFSQPQHHVLDPEMISSRQIYSLHQQFQYTHEVIEAEKSRKSRYSKKLDQQLQSEERRQYTEIQSLNQKIEKLEYNSQSNHINFCQSIQSQQQSLPLPEIKNQILKKEQQDNGFQESDGDYQLRLRSPSAQLYEDALNQKFKLSQSYSELPKKEKQEDQPQSGGLFSDEQERSSSHREQLKKQEQQDQAYAVISIQEEIKRQNVFKEQVLNWEEPRHFGTLNNDFTSYLANPSQRMDEIPHIKEEEEKQEVEQCHDALNQQEQQFNVKIINKDDNQDENHFYPQQISSQQLVQPLSNSQNNDQLSYRADPNYSEVYVQNSRQQEKQNYKEEEQPIQNLSEDQSQNQEQLSSDKKDAIPRISKKIALQLKKQSKNERISIDGSQNDENKGQHLSITKTMELNINKCQVVSNRNLDEVSKQDKSSKIRIANQFSFYECGSSIASEKSKKPPKIEYIRQQDYDPDKYEEIQEVIYKVARKSRPKYKRRIIEQIYQPVPIRKGGNTKKLARQYARNKYQSRKEKCLPIQSEDEVEEIYYQQSVSANNESEVIQYPKPPAHRSKKRKQRVRYIYVDESHKNSKNSKYKSRVIEDSSSSESEEQKQNKRMQTFRKH